MSISHLFSTSIDIHFHQWCIVAIIVIVAVIIVVVMVVAVIMIMAVIMVMAVVMVVAAFAVISSSWKAVLIKIMAVECFKLDWTEARPTMDRVIDKRKGAT